MTPKETLEFAKKNGVKQLENYVSYKRKFEADAVRLRPHPYEFALYYDI